MTIVPDISFFSSFFSSSSSSSLAPRAQPPMDRRPGAKAEWPAHMPQTQLWQLACGRQHRRHPLVTRRAAQPQEQTHAFESGDFARAAGPSSVHFSKKPHSQRLFLFSSSFSSCYSSSSSSISSCPSSWPSKSGQASSPGSDRRGSVEAVPLSRRSRSDCRSGRSFGCSHPFSRR